MSAVLINDEIPRTMTRSGLTFLGRLARLVPKNGLIVEVGPLFGSSTWVLSKNSDPSVRIISIDSWEPQPWIEKIEEKYPGCRPFSKDTFLHNMRDCPNVEARQGFSPDIMKDWHEDIDLFFDDATHGDPGFSDSLNFYLPKLRPNGIACGDDFAGGWPDIVKGVTGLAASWNTSPEIVGRVWAMIKPDASGATSTIYAKAGPYTPYDLEIVVKSEGIEKVYPAGGWAGKLHDTSCLSAFKIDWVDRRLDDLSGLVQARNIEGGESPWFRFGEWVEVEGRMSSFRCRLTGDSGGLDLSYQACEIVQGRRNTYTRNTRTARNDEWIIADGGNGRPPQGIVALRCEVIDRSVES